MTRESRGERVHRRTFLSTRPASALACALQPSICRVVELDHSYRSPARTIVLHMEFVHKRARQVDTPARTS